MLETITATGLELTGEEAKVVQSQVSSPQDNLSRRAFDMIFPGLRGQALSQAQEKLRQEFEATGSAAGLPNAVDDAAVLAWWFAHPEFKDATEIAQDKEVEQLREHIARLDHEITQYQRNIDGTNDADMKALYQTRIDEREQEKAALQAQIDALQAPQA